MRLRQGHLVEVWTQEAGSPVGAWRGGEVTWGNGHSYTLQWHDCDEVSGRIPRRSVRPRPPPAPVPRDLEAGDMVEVFDDDDCLWKCAEVLRVPFDAGRRYDVKVVGAAKSLAVPPQRLRLRQVLRENDVWVRLYKGKQIAVASTAPSRVKGKGVGRGRGGSARGGSVGVGRGNGGGYAYEPMALDTNPLMQKRSFGMLDPETIPDGRGFEDRDSTSKRLRVEGEPEPRYGVEVIVPNVRLNKQDEMSGEDLDMVTTGSNSNDDQHQQQQSEDDDDDSESASSSDASSSSGSSSDGDSDSDSDSRTRSIDAGDDELPAAAPASTPACNDQNADQQRLQQTKTEHARPRDDQNKNQLLQQPNADQLHQQPKAQHPPPCDDQNAGQLQQPKREERQLQQPKGVQMQQQPKREEHQLQQPKREEHSVDAAESSREDKREHLNDEKAAAAAGLQYSIHVHRLELEAYTALTKAFHACSPALSWEKVALLTDLRTHLHISNDEHLQVLNTVLKRKGRCGPSGAS